MNPSRPVVAGVQNLEPCDLKGGFRDTPLKDDQGLWDQPAAREQLGEGDFAKPLGIGGVQEGQVEGGTV